MKPSIGRIVPSLTEERLTADRYGQMCDCTGCDEMSCGLDDCDECDADSEHPSDHCPGRCVRHPSATEAQDLAELDEW